MDKSFYRRHLDILPPLVPLATVWMLMTLVHFVDWGLGFQRGVTLIALLGCVMSIRVEPRFSERAGMTMLGLLTLAAAAVFLYGLFRAVPLDIGESTVRSLDALLADFANPYSTQVDEVDVGRPGYFYGGYKYLPVTLAIYLPGVAAFGEKGLYLTNLLFFAGTLWVLLALARQVTDNATVPVLLYAGSVTVIYENFIIGANDGPIVFFALAAVLAAFHNRERLSALLLSITIATKWPVGGLYFLALLPFVTRRWQFFAWAAIIPAVTLLLFFLWHPSDFFANTVLYWIDKKPDSTGFLTKFPSSLQLPIRLGLIAVFWGFWFVYLQQPKSRANLIRAIAVLVTIFVLIPRENHRNHMLWLFPVIALIAVQPGLQSSVRRDVPRTE